MKRLVLGLLAACTAIQPAIAETDIEEAAAVFGKREALLDVSLSPSGQKLAYISSIGFSTEAIFIVDLVKGGQPKPIMKFDDEEARLWSCEWATEERLVCYVSYIHDDNGLLLGFSRVMSVSADGSNPIMLTEDQSMNSLSYIQHGGNVIALDLEEEDRVLMTRQWVKERSIATRLANTDEGLGVERVDIYTGKRSREEKPSPDTISYVADETGRVRLKIRQPDRATGMMGNRREFWFRPQDSNEWLLLSKVTVDGQTYDGFYPVAVDGAKNVAYAFADKDGFEALYSIPLVEGGRPQLVLAKDNVEVDGLIRIGRQRRVVGASYATDRRQVSYIDSELAALAQGLAQALPGKPLINIIDASADENKLLIVAASDTDPGMTYLYDKAGRRLEPLLPIRSHMDDRALGEMRSITYPAGDGVQVPGYLTLPPGSDGKNIPAIVLPHGGPSARDEWGFDWLVQFFASRGYAVLQPNYRGSAGLGNEWFGRNGFQAWETAISDVNDAGRWLVSQGIADPSKLAIVGWSYGGYAALQSQVLDPSLYQAIVAIAPVADLEQLRSEAMRYTSGTLVDQFIGQGPHVAAGSPARNADRFQSPVLLFHGTYDQNVDVMQSRRMRSALESAGKEVDYVEFDKLTHSLAESKTRYEMLTRIDQFLSSELAD